MATGLSEEKMVIISWKLDFCVDFGWNLLDGSVGTYGVILDGRTSFFSLVGDNGDY